MDNGSIASIIEKLQKTVERLEKRIDVLEGKLDIKERAPLTETDVDQTPRILIDMKDIENLTGESQLGWLAIFLSITGTVFFMRYLFQKNLITGWGQPVSLFIVSTALLFIADYLIRKKIKKFGSALTIAGYLILFLSLYWVTLRLGLIDKWFLFAGSGVTLAVAVSWGFMRNSSLWPIWGFISAGCMIILTLNDSLLFNYAPYSLILLLAVCFTASIKKDWKWFPLFGTVIGHTAIAIGVKQFFLFGNADITAIYLLITVIPAILLLWGGIIHSISKRPPERIEIAIWITNNVIMLTGIKSVWSRLEASYLLLIPVAVNGLIYYLSKKRVPESRFPIYYLTGLVITAGICLTFLLPEPFDIITLCFFAVFLAYLGNREEGWDFKTLSGAVVVWCLLFLFIFRFSFTGNHEIPFLNFRFISFSVAFFCFGYQGKMINSDPSAGKMGPVLGQGLFSLGLLVLLSGIGGEIYQVFPPDKPHLFISQEALLGLSVLGAFFSFILTYLGIAMRLFFIRIMALLLILLLVTKLLVLDLAGLKPLYLIISLTLVALLLGSTSIILKNYSKQRKEGANAG